MRNKTGYFCVLLLLGVFIFKVQPGFSRTSEPDSNSAKSLNNIAVAAVEDNETSKISEIAGKAPWYLIFDETGVFLKSIENPAQSSRRDSSSIVINLLLKESCKTAIAGEFGRKMQNQLKTNKIEYYECQGIAKSVVQKFVSAQQTKEQ